MADIHTIRSGPNLIETMLSGRISEADTRQMGADFARFGSNPIWLIVLDDSTTEYAPRAIDSMSRVIEQLERANGLKMLVAVIQSTFVRMGATFVATMVKLPIKIVRTRVDAVALIRKLEPTLK